MKGEVKKEYDLWERSSSPKLEDAARITPLQLFATVELHQV